MLHSRGILFHFSKKGVPMYNQYLVFNGENLPMPQNYDISLSSVVADSSGETEAGTTQRDVVRSGIVNIAVSFQVTAVWLKKFSAYSKLAKITVRYFDTDDLSLKTTEMYIDGYKATLYKDTAKKGFWNVSFTLKEM